MISDSGGIYSPHQMRLGRWNNYSRIMNKKQYLLLNIIVLVLVYFAVAGMQYSNDHPIGWIENIFLALGLMFPGAVVLFVIGIDHRG
jgi:protein-S-isoprenylcysteine O-methyltransferase Ste14